MLRVLLKVVLILSATGSAVAQGTPRTLLWKVTGEGLEKPSYIYGTVHSRDSRAFGLGDSVFMAMGRVSVVAGELDLEQGAQQAIAMMSAMMLPDGQRLEDLYKKKDWERIDTAIKAQLGPMSAMVQRMKPFFVMAMLTESSMGADEDKVLDDHILSTARAQGQRVIGIETLKEQMAAMDALPIKEQAAMLLDHVKNDGYQGDLDALMDAYEAQDLDALMKITEGSKSMSKSLEKALLTDRNHRMVHRLDSIMQGNEDIFFAVGAAHLPGKQGLIDLLKQKGYAVEPVHSSPGSRQTDRSTELDLPVAAKGFAPAESLSRGIRYVNDTLDFSVEMPAPPVFQQAASDTWLFHSIDEERKDQVVVGIQKGSKYAGRSLEDFIENEILADGATVSVTTFQGQEARRIDLQANQDMITMVVFFRNGDLFTVTTVSEHEGFGDSVLPTFTLD